MPVLFVYARVGLYVRLFDVILIFAANKFRIYSFFSSSAQRSFSTLIQNVNVFCCGKRVNITVSSLIQPSVCVVPVCNRQRLWKWLRLVFKEKNYIFCPSNTSKLEISVSFTAFGNSTFATSYKHHRVHTDISNFLCPQNSERINYSSF